MTRKRIFTTLLFTILLISLWPMLLAFSPTVGANGILAMTFSSSNLVPFVIAASFTRITGDDNKLKIKGKGDAEEGTREQIFSLIESNPGIHFRDICRRLKKEIGVVQYHVYVLQRFSMISSLKDGRFTRFFVKDNIYDDDAKQIIAAWHRPVEKKMLLAMIGRENEKITSKVLVKKCAVTTQAITWHVNRLRKNGLLQNNNNSKIHKIIPEIQDKILNLAEKGFIRLK
ncbi:MAG: winged helix-turn-helix transcriptional regulator [Candidatus Hodarchaeota archaeon]